MESPSSSLISAFAPAARRVLVRVWLRRWIRLLGRSIWWINGALVAELLIANQWTDITWLKLLPWLTVQGWLIVPLGLIWRRKPTPYGALALWDQVTNRREAFAAAWWFEQQPGPLTPAQQAHVEAQRVRLQECLPTLTKDLPLQPNRWLGLPVCLVALSFALTVVFPRQQDELLSVMDDAMKQKAQEEVAKLAQTEWDKKKLEGLKTEEQEELDQLKENLKQTASNLEKAGGKDAREVMAELESRAREAEKLADRLRADKGDWASEKLTQTLRKHADTADLGDAVSAKNAPQAAAAAEKLAQALKSPQLTNDAAERLKETLKEAQKQADAEDKNRIVGQPVLSAAEKMQQTQIDDAGDQFEKLANAMRELARRDETRKELEKLAQQLRDSGSNMAGQNGAGSMQQMTAGEQSGQDQRQGQSAPQVGQMQPNQGLGQQNSLQPPGLGNSSQGQQPQQMMTPVPGTENNPQQMMMGQSTPGQQGQPQGSNPGQGQPMLLAPIPGAKPGEQPSALFLGQQPQGSPDPNAPAVAIPVPGGKQAGAGVAKLNAEATQLQKTANQSMVTAQQNSEGQSSVRAVEGGTRTEQAERTANQVTVEFIQAEEEALDETPLPPSRREQVRRYFSELRKRFERSAAGK